MPVKSAGGGLTKRYTNFDPSDRFTTKFIKSSAPLAHTLVATSLGWLLPADLAVGDLIMVSWFGPSAPTLGPSTYTSLGAQGTAPNIYGVSYRVASAADVTAAAAGTLQTAAFGASGLIGIQAVNMGPSVGAPSLISADTVTTVSGASGWAFPANYQGTTVLAAAWFRLAGNVAFTAGPTNASISTTTARGKLVASGFTTDTNGTAHGIFSTDLSQPATSPAYGGLTQGASGGTVTRYGVKISLPLRPLPGASALLYDYYYGVNPPWSEMIPNTPYRASAVRLLVLPSIGYLIYADIAVGPPGQEVVVANAVPIYSPNYATYGNHGQYISTDVPVIIPAGSRVSVRLSYPDPGSTFSGSAHTTRAELLA